jgi:hypothetical protein
MALVCVLNPCRLCNGCMVCQEPQPEPEEERGAAIDRAYEREEE